MLSKFSVRKPFTVLVAVVICLVLGFLSFQNMSTDEKLAEIANLIENMLKKDGKFQSLDYTKICFDYIDGDMIKRYRKQIQCFRHSAPESIHERETFSKEQKVFLIDLGLTILKAIHALLNNE